VIVRKLALPLEIQMGDDTVISDGFFSLTSKEAYRINVKKIDSDGYATCEIVSPPKLRMQSLSVIFGGDVEHLGTESSLSRGSGEKLGQYNYYKRPNEFYYAMVEGKNGERKINLGRLANRKSRISIFARTVARLLNGNEFTRKDIILQIRNGMPRQLTHGQILKSMLFVLTKEGYLERRTANDEHKRPREYYKTTAKLLNQIKMFSPEQAYSA